jgi:hypothetical protein
MAYIEIFQSMWIIVPIFPARRSRTHIHIIHIIVNESLLFSSYDLRLHITWLSVSVTFFHLHCPRSYSRSIESFEEKKESVRNECGRFMRTVLILFPYQYILLTTVFLLIHSRKINDFYLVSDISWDIMNV